MREIIFFYEAHSDITASKTMSECIEFFKEKGITHIAIEKSSDKNPIIDQDELNNYSTVINNLKNYLKNIQDNLTDPELQDYIDALLDRNGIVSYEDRESGLKFLLNRILTEFTSNLYLKRVVEEVGCKVFSMDLPKDKMDDDLSQKDAICVRDEYMYDIIKSNISDNQQSKTIVLVGSAHNALGDMFRNSDDGEYLVKEILFDDQSVLYSDLEVQIVSVLRDRLKKQCNDGIYIDSSDKDTLDYNKIKNDLYEFLSIDNDLPELDQEINSGVTMHMADVSVTTEPIKQDPEILGDNS